MGESTKTCVQVDVAHCQCNLTMTQITDEVASKSKYSLLNSVKYSSLRKRGQPS